MREQTERAICAGYELRIRREFPGAIVSVERDWCDIEGDDGRIRVGYRYRATVRWHQVECEFFWREDEPPSGDRIRRALRAKRDHERRQLGLPT